MGHRFLYDLGGIGGGAVGQYLSTKIFSATVKKALTFFFNRREYAGHVRQNHSSKMV